MSNINDLIQKVLVIINKYDRKIMHNTLKKEMCIENRKFDEIINYLIDTKQIKTNVKKNE